MNPRVKKLEWSYEKVAMKIRPGKGKLGLTIKIKNGVGAEIIDIPDRASCRIVGNISVGDVIISIRRTGVGAKLSERQITSKADFAVDTDKWRRISVLTKKTRFPSRGQF